MQVAVDEAFGLRLGDEVARQRPLVDLGQRIVKGLAEAESLVQRGVEAVEEP